MHNQVFPLKTPVPAAALAAALFLAASCTTGLPLSPANPVAWESAPTLPEGVTPDMRTPGYWLRGMEDPDRILLDPQAREALNRSIRDKGLVRDLREWKAPSGPELAKTRKDNLEWIAGQRLWRDDGTPVDKALLASLEALENTGNLPDSPALQPAVLCRRADLRVLPTARAFWDGQFEYFTDMLQASSLEPGEACMVQHASADGKWLLVTTAFASGWLPADALGFCDSATISGRLERDDFLVVVHPRSELWADGSRHAWAGWLRPGTKVFPAASQQTVPGMVALAMPERRDDGTLGTSIRWMREQDLHRGYLDCTVRNVLELAFASLDEPYGWGGMFGTSDCSQFLQQTFGAAGIILPRNSTAQGKSGRNQDGFAADTPPAEKLALLEKEGVPGFTLLRMSGHIMLWLGMQDGRGWILHQTWAYKAPGKDADRIRLVNQVTVSSLDLGAGTLRKSHLERLTNAAILVPHRED